MTAPQAIPATIVSKLVKIIPYLGSNHEGEVINAVKAIEQTLKSGGCDWHDMAASLSAPVVKIPNADWRREARFCVDNADLLDERELNFITNIACSRRKPTEKQMQWLCHIVARLRGAA